MRSGCVKDSQKLYFHSARAYQISGIVPTIRYRERTKADLQMDYIMYCLYHEDHLTMHIVLM